MEQNFGIKDLYEVMIKAKVPLKIGDRVIEADEPILCLNRVLMADISQKTKPIAARGGHGNFPQVIWEDNSEVTFSMTEGVVSPTGLSLLWNCHVVDSRPDEVTLVPKRDGPFYLDNMGCFTLSRTPTAEKKMFCYSFDKNLMQEKQTFTINGNIVTVENGDSDSQYVFDYYFEYGEKVLSWLIKKERLNGTFYLEAKFYSKDENDGIERTSLIYLPKIKIVSNLNLSLGEKANPVVSIFNIIAMPDLTPDSNSLVMKITQLDDDIDGDI